ncbi:MAG: hypothetical protein HXX14_01130 [Bacteroidetes bacterium]|nr:hypothetical protein [Bacteroidota bacterium]
MNKSKHNKKTLLTEGLEESKKNCNDSSSNQPSEKKSDEGEKKTACNFTKATPDGDHCLLKLAFSNLIRLTRKTAKENELLLEYLDGSIHKSLIVELNKTRLDFSKPLDDDDPPDLSNPEDGDTTQEIRVNATANEFGIAVGKFLFNTLNSKGEPMFVTKKPNAAALICDCFEYFDGTAFNQRTIEDALAVGKRSGKNFEPFSKN